MAIIVLLLALAQIAGGILFAIMAKTAMHEVIAAVCFGSGVVSFALSAIIAKMDDAVKLRHKD